jgi:hypothetical protein
MTSTLLALRTQLDRPWIAALLFWLFVFATGSFSARAGVI